MVRRGVAAAAAAALLSVCPRPADAQPGAAAAPADTSERAYLAGNGLLGRGLHKLAAAEYRSFLAEHPEHPKAPLARYGLGVALLNLGRHEEARQQLAAIKPGGDFPYTVEVAVMLGQCRLALGEYEGAAADFERTLARHSEHELADDAAALLSEACYRSGNFRGAVRASAWLAERWPDSPVRGTAELFGGLALLELGDGAGARAVLRSAVTRLTPSLLREHGTLALARALTLSGSGAEAEPLLRELLRSEDAGVRIGAAASLADVLRARGEFARARRLLEDAARAAEKGAWRGDLLFRLAQVCFDERKFEEALARFEASAAEDEGRADQAAYWAAKCCLRMDRHEEAAQRLATAIARHEGSGIRAEMKYDLAVALLRAGRDAQAARAFDDFRAEFPQHELWPEATRVVGSIALRSGDAEAALAAATDLLRHPAGEADHAAARLMLAQAHAAAGRDAEAAAAYRGYLTRHPRDEHAAHASLQLATLLLKSGDTQGARELLAIAADHHDAAVSGPALLLLGDLELAAEQWAEAAARFRAYRSLPGAPEVDEALLKLGVALARSGRADEARAALTQLAGDRRAGALAARARLELGSLELAAGDLAAAQRALSAVAEGDAPSEIVPYALLNLGIVAERAGRREEAAARFRQVAEGAGPADVRAEAVFLHARMFAAAGAHAEAAELFERLAGTQREHPRRAEARAHAAIARSRAGDVDAALQQLESILESDSAEVSADLRGPLLYERAWCLQRLGRRSEATTAYRDALARARGSGVRAYAALGLAEMEAEADRPEEAAAILDGLLREHSELAPDALMQVRYRLGALQARLARHEDAAATLRDLLAHAEDLDPAIRASATLLLADSFAALDRHEEAASLLRPLAADPPDAATGAGALLRLGDALARVQNWPGSEEAFAAFLERAPDSELWFQARFGLGWARENLGRHEEAIEQYRHVVEHHQGQTAARAQFQIGECLFALSRHAEAAAELLKVDILYAYPEWSAAALFEAGRCFEAMGDIAEARRQYAAVQDRFAQTHWAQLARSRLAAARPEPVPGR